MSISFADFVHIISDYEAKRLNPHWAIQSNLILYDLIKYSFIGRFENYIDDYNALFKQLNCNNIPNLRHKNKRIIDIKQSPTELITVDLQKLIYNRYRADFDNFDYPYELPEKL